MAETGLGCVSLKSDWKYKCPFCIPNATIWYIYVLKVLHIILLMSLLLYLLKYVLNNIILPEEFRKPNFYLLGQQKDETYSSQCNLPVVIL